MPWKETTPVLEKSKRSVRTVVDAVRVMDVAPEWLLIGRREGDYGVAAGAKVFAQPLGVSSATLLAGCVLTRCKTSAR